MAKAASILKSGRMSPYKSIPRRTDENKLLRLHAVDPVITGHLNSLLARYGKYATSSEETRRTIDKAMGIKSLTGVLYQLREEGM